MPRGGEHIKFKLRFPWVRDMVRPNLPPSRHYEPEEEESR